MNFGFWEILLICLLVFLLFGANKFPTMMKNLADGLKVFKKEMNTKSEASKPKGAKPADKGNKPVAKSAVKSVSVKKPATKKVVKKK